MLRISCSHTLTSCCKNFGNNSIAYEECPHSLLFFLSASRIIAQSPSHDLHFYQLANVCDEGIPLGNATVGALVWKKGEHLRFSLDRADIWDMRPTKGLHRKEFSYAWVPFKIKQDDLNHS